MDKNAIYAIRFAGDDEYTSLAVDCQPWHVKSDTEYDGIAYLTPPDRGHMIPGTVTEEIDDGFKFLSTGYAPGEWEFAEITIDNFRERFGNIVMADERLDLVKTTEELQECFHSLY